MVIIFLILFFYKTHILSFFIHFYFTLFGKFTIWSSNSRCRESLQFTNSLPKISWNHWLFYMLCCFFWWYCKNFVKLDFSVTNTQKETHHHASNSAKITQIYSYTFFFRESKCFTKILTRVDLTEYFWGRVFFSFYHITEILWKQRF